MSVRRNISDTLLLLGQLLYLLLQVVNDMNLAEAGYINNTFTVVSGVLLLVVGYVIRRTGHFKWLLYFAVPL